MKHTKGPWEMVPINRDFNAYWKIKPSYPFYGEVCLVHRLRKDGEANAQLITQAPAMYDQLASARAIMQKFVDKVDSGLARSTETYAEMKQWLEDCNG